MFVCEAVSTSSLISNSHDGPHALSLVRLETGELMPSLGREFEIITFAASPATLRGMAAEFLHAADAAESFLAAVAAPAKGGA